LVHYVHFTQKVKKNVILIVGRPGLKDCYDKLSDAETRRDNAAAFGG